MAASLGLFTDKKLRDLQDIRSQSADFFKALGLLWAYQYMIFLADRGTKSHPEVMRAPIIRDMLLEHFVSEYANHINVETGRIFNAASIGTWYTLRAWQNAGYVTRRSRRNYARRLLYWKAIYDESDVIVKRKNPKRAPRGVSAEEAHKYGPYANLGRVKDGDGTIITYEIMIERRNSHYGATRQLVPFWMVLNYGTNGIRGEPSGYPVVPGIFFVENAEKRIAEYTTRALRFYESFALDVLTKERQGASIGDAYDWARRRGPTFRYTYLNDTLAAARQLAEVF